MFDLDINSFWSLHSACCRLDARQKIETFTSRNIAAQGDGKAGKEHRKTYEDRLKSSEAGRLDEDEFLAKHGKGI